MRLPKLTVRVSPPHSDMILAESSESRPEPLRGRCASLDTAATVKGWQL